MTYNTRFSIQLRPHGAVSPKIKYGVDGQIANTELEINVPMSLYFNLDLEKGPHVATIEFYNKTNDTPDMAVEIESVTFEGMTLDRFKWANKYYPNYPEPWASTQTNLEPVLTSSTYLGWNGRWELHFDAPVFTWIHQIENLGWIYY